MNMVDSEDIIRPSFLCMFFPGDTWNPWPFVEKQQDDGLEDHMGPAKRPAQRAGTWGLLSWCVETMC